MTELRTGILLWGQGTTWPDLRDAALLVDRLGYDHLWAWDHLYAIFGDPYQPIYEGWSLLSAYAVVTERTRLGMLVGANTFRNPGIVAKSVTTLDHVSGGRAILGIGGAWFELEHTAHGIEFGSGHGERLTWMDEAAHAVRRLLDGEEVSSSPDGRYAFREARHAPAPIQEHLPIMIGGSGEKKTLRTVAAVADLWNAMGSVEKLRRKVEVLREHCDAVGRDPSAIEYTLGTKLTIRDSQEEAERVWRAQMEHNRTPLANVEADDTFWRGTPEQIAERIGPYLELGFTTVISEQPAPFDRESLERFIGEVKPLVERG